MSLRAWRFLNSDETTSIGVGFSILCIPLSSGLDVVEHVERRILDEVHSMGTLWETAGGASYLLYSQDAGFCDLYDGASFGSHQQGRRLVPQ